MYTFCLKLKKVNNVNFVNFFNNVNLLTLNRIHNCSGVSIIDYGQVNSEWGLYGTRIFFQSMLWKP